MVRYLPDLPKNFSDLAASPEAALWYHPSRCRLHDTPLDIKGAGKSVTVVVWAIRESGNHALAGIWHEGTDLKQEETAGIAKVERGQRQASPFVCLLLFDEFEVCFGEGFAHLSEDFCAAEVVVAAIGCALECFSVFG